MKNTKQNIKNAERGDCAPEVEAATDTAKVRMMTEEKAAKDPVFKQYGAPFVINESKKVTLNERAVAAKCATMHQVKYAPTTKTYTRFDNGSGLWVTIHEVEVRRLLGDLLLHLGKEYEQEDFVQTSKTSLYNSVAKMLQSYDADIEPAGMVGLFHVANGLLDLRQKKPNLITHSAKYDFKISSGITFDPKAKCPRFLRELLEPALEKDDITLLQKYFGSMLLGANTCHGILLVRGTPGGGKSTLVSLLEKMLSESMVAHLRTQHLNGRFETSAFLGKRVLVGKDVPGDTLSEKGARMLKSLVGGDLLQAEIKYNPNKQMIRGDFHVVITSNNNLRIALDGDDDAWRRRLLIVDFENPKPKKAIADFATVLFKEEQSGILNWLIDGAAQYREEMSRKGTLALTEKQEQRVATLLYDSDSVVSFVDQRVRKQKDADVSSEELVLGYYRACKERNWNPVSGKQFLTRVRDLLCTMHFVCRRNDIKRDGKAVRGFKGLALI